MWRRYGDVPYALLVLGVFTIELCSLGALTWIASLRLGGLIPAARVEEVLLATVISTAVALLLLSAYVLAYHVLSVPRERVGRERTEDWVELWVNILVGAAPAPTVLPRGEALEAAL